MSSGVNFTSKRSINNINDIVNNTTQMTEDSDKTTKKELGTALRRDSLVYIDNNAINNNNNTQKQEEIADDLNKLFDRFLLVHLGGKEKFGYLTKEDYNLTNIETDFDSVFYNIIKKICEILDLELKKVDTGKERKALTEILKAWADDAFQKNQKERIRKKAIILEKLFHTIVSPELISSLRRHSL